MSKKNVDDFIETIKDNISMVYYIMEKLNVIINMNDEKDIIKNSKLKLETYKTELKDFYSNDEEFTKKGIKMYFKAIDSISNFIYKYKNIDCYESNFDKVEISFFIYDILVNIKYNSGVLHGRSSHEFKVHIDGTEQPLKQFCCIERNSLYLKELDDKLKKHNNQCTSNILIDIVDYICVNETDS